MPDPRDPTPVRAERRESEWVVVDKDGNQLPEGAGLTEQKARRLAETVNSGWDRARKERAANEEAELEEFSLRTLARPEVHLDFDPAKHPRDRLGRFSEVLGKLMGAGAGSTVRLPHGVTVKRTSSGLHVADFSPRVPGLLGETEDALAAAAQALHLHDERAVAKGAANFADTLRGRREELRTARTNAAVKGGDPLAIDDLKRALGRSINAHHTRYVEPMIRGRSAASRDTSVPLYARNRPAGHPLKGAEHHSKEERARHAREIFPTPKGAGKRKAVSS